MIQLLYYFLLLLFSLIDLDGASIEEVANHQSKIESVRMNHQENVFAHQNTELISHRRGFSFSKSVLSMPKDSVSKRVEFISYNAS